MMNQSFQDGCTSSLESAPPLLSTSFVPAGLVYAKTIKADNMETQLQACANETPLPKEKMPEPEEELPEPGHEEVPDDQEPPAT